MTDWQIVFGDAQPADFDAMSSKFYVYQRRNPQLITSDNGEFWQYDERKLTREEYLKMQVDQLQDENTCLQLALTELYEEMLQKG